MSRDMPIFSHCAGGVRKNTFFPRGGVAFFAALWYNILGGEDAVRAPILSAVQGGRKKETPMPKFLIASDLHGSAHYTKELLAAFVREGADRLVLLGDILYHGPRNDLPEAYAPKEVIALLSPYADRILAVRGNCDTEVDQMVLPFPILADYAVIAAGERLLYLTHGHKWGEDNPPPIAKGDILVTGHTHVAKIAKKEGYTYLNPGSVSIPKENTPQGYILLDGVTFTFKTLAGEEYDSFTLA